jgi:glycosyltransferase involved in cell wall biosynthesis
MDNSHKIPDCSIVVPLYNESNVVDELYSRLTAVMDETGLGYELVFVDDGSKDDTLSKLKVLAAADKRVLVVELRRNYGQTPALAAGFDNARGEIIISMDGDLQHLPEEIPAFLDKINEGYDVVSGWRKHRVDNFIMRRIPSRIANWIASKVSGVDIHDFGTTFKAYRRDVIENLKLYGETHRFIPAIVSGQGAKIVEIPITNISRPKGKSNYGISRTFKVMFDLITLRFILAYASKPLHFFGKGALFYCFVPASAMGVYIFYDKFVYNVPISVAHVPMAGLMMLLFVVGFVLIATGLIGEMVCRVYYEATNAKIYSVRKIYRKDSSAQVKS